MIMPLSTTLLGLAALLLYWLVRRTEATPPIDWRGVLARLPLPMLALAASYGVYSFARLFVPDAVAVIQAAAFELTYIGLAVTRTLDSAERKRATLISVGAVVASIVYNTLAGWFHRQPQLLDASNAYADVTWLMFAILHGAPLAWVAYLVADLLLHTQPKMASRRPRQLRALIHRLARLLRTARAQVAPLEAMLAVVHADLESVRAMLAQQGDQLAQALIEAAQANADRASWQQQAAQNEADAARAVRDAETSYAKASEALRDLDSVSREAAQLRVNSARADDLAAQLENETTQRARDLQAFDQVAAQLREELALARAASGLDVLVVARRLVAADVPLREIAPLLGLAESTLRGRLKAQTNGHAVE
jgi:hypothetical protein